MSLILEALRKSEAERRRAQVPDLLAEPQAATVPVAATPQRWPWLVLGAAMLLGTLWLARAWWGAPAPRVDGSIAGDRNSSEGRTTANRTSTRPASTAMPSARPLVLAPPVAAVPASDAPSASDAPPTDGNPASASAARDATSVETAVAPAPPVLAAPAAPAPVAAAHAPADPLLRLSDLGSEERSQLPPLKLSMHMWNDAPAQRFVIIDGNRVGIGGRIGAVAVADIVSDGVVLDWNGRLLKLPLR